uniref:LON peptidase N-terminal domain and ring finger 2 n=1 Tax=Erpetoichthys calabaricus TaxID=27687 RepID=A0A8C4RVH3_ERPCA
MDTSTVPRSEPLLHELTNPNAPGICNEMLDVAQEAFQVGNYELAAEIYGSQLVDLAEPDRGLCLRKGDALARAGRVAEALDSYRCAAGVNRLRPEELRLLVESIAQNLRDKELKLPPPERCSNDTGDGELERFTSLPDSEDSMDMFSCRLCGLLLTDPTTLQCGHTYCKRCLESEEMCDCRLCKHKLSKKVAKVCSMGFRANVLLCGLMDKWFEKESRARRCCLEGDVLCRKQQDFTGALAKYNHAVDLVPSNYIAVCQRGELHLTMKNYIQAVQDGENACKLKPLRPKAHYLKATALNKMGRCEEALKEFLFCAALRPDWSSVKLEAQKILCEMFSSVFENDRLPVSRPTLSSYMRLKSSVVSTEEELNAECSEVSTFAVFKSGSCENSRYSSIDSLKPKQTVNKLQLCFDDTKALGSILPCLPEPSRKRKCFNDCEVPCKMLKQDENCSTLKTTDQKISRDVSLELVDSSDLECSLCMRLFYEPVATPCGHTFCLKCLERCLDHNPYCPLCKENLSEYLATRAYNKTFLTEEIINRYLSEELTERKKIYDEEMKELSNLNKEVPIFVCTMAFPTIPCPLHVFEPRYRLMIRRCMETGTRQFGMCIADELKGFADYGCMLEVRDVKFFPDGRSVVDTIGVSRFKVLSHSQRDGYNTAKIEYLEDRKTEGEEYAELVRLHDSVYDQAVSWFTSLKDAMKNQILSHFGPMPVKESDPQASPSGPAWCWWLLAVLPLENRAQLTILAMTSLKDRLIAVRRVLIFVTRKRPR